MALSTGRRTSNLRRNFLTASISSLVLSSSAFAQLEEVLVTAQKRVQSMQDVGVAVTAINSESMRERGVAGMADISKVAPGVVFESTSGSTISMNVGIRGVQQSDFSLNQESPNSIYIDEVYISSPYALGYPLFDMDRIEVLRGPQGTLFGRASSGGLVSYFSRRPSDEFEGYLEGSIQNYDGYTIEGAISGPISDSTRGRLSGRWGERDGYFRNHLDGNGDYMESEARSIRGQIETDLTDSLMGRLSLSYDRSPTQNQGVYKAESGYFNSEGVAAPLPPNIDGNGTGPGNDFFGYRDPYSDAHDGSFNDNGFVNTRRTMPTLYLEWAKDDFTLTSVTSYVDFEADYSEDCDGGPTPGCEFPVTQSMKQWSQELRLNGIDEVSAWTAGLYILDIQQDGTLSFEFPVLSGTDFAFSDFNEFEQSLRSYAVFGQYEYDLTDRLRGIVGMRYTRDEKDFSSQVYYKELGNGYSGGTGSTVFDPPLLDYNFSESTAGGLAEQDEGMWSGKIQLDYTATDNLFFYVGASLGAKGPGFNANVGGAATFEETPFDSESVLVFEFGSKWDIVDLNMRFNTSAFYYDYSDFQGFAFSGLQGVVGNYDATFQGAEIELTGYFATSFDYGLSASYIDSNVEDVATAYSGIQDQESILAPEWTANGFVKKTFDFDNGNALSFQWSFDYIDDRFASIDNNPATALEGGVIHNARADYDMPGIGVNFAVWVDNVTDEDRESFVFDVVASTGSLLKSYKPPRMYGLTVRKDF